MGLIDGTTRDECLSLEALMQNYAANGQWLQAWVVSLNIVMLRYFSKTQCVTQIKTSLIFLSF